MREAIVKLSVPRFRENTKKNNLLQPIAQLAPWISAGIEDGTTGGVILCHSAVEKSDNLALIASKSSPKFRSSLGYSSELDFRVG